MIASGAASPLRILRTTFAVSVAATSVDEPPPTSDREDGPSSTATRTMDFPFARRVNAPAMTANRSAPVGGHRLRSPARALQKEAAARNASGGYVFDVMRVQRPRPAPPADGSSRPQLPRRGTRLDIPDRRSTRPDMPTPSSRPIKGHVPMRGVSTRISNWATSQSQCRPLMCARLVATTVM